MREVENGNYILRGDIKEKKRCVKRFLTFIEKNSRIDLKELAIVLGVDETTVMNELEKMEEEHIICGYHTLIDWDKAGIEKVTALIEVRVTPQRGMFDKVAERIYKPIGGQFRLPHLRRL